MNRARDTVAAPVDVKWLAHLKLALLWSAVLAVLAFETAAPGQRDTHHDWIISGICVVVLQTILIAALVVNRRPAQESTEQLLRCYEFGTLISELSKAFINLPPERVAVEIDHSLRQILEFLQLDRITLVEFVEPSFRLSSCSTRAAGDSDAGPRYDLAAFLLSMERLSQNKWEVQAEDGLPERVGSRPGFVAPLETAGRTIGVLMFYCYAPEAVWPSELLQQLGLVGDVFAKPLERRRAQAALGHLSGRLMTAQEEERTALARELHDDFSQRLALLAMAAERASRNLDASQSDARDQVHTLFDQAVKLSSDLRLLSHKLHSTSLDHLGLVSAVQELCTELQAQHGIEVRLTANHFPRLSSRLQLNLFRVVQQALSNVVRHSGSKTVHVEIFAGEGKAQARVRDHGSGFDAAATSKGIGLISMRERVRLEAGTFTLRSKPGEGTEIEVSVPLSVSGDRGQSFNQENTCAAHDTDC